MIDIICTSTLRPELLEITFNSFVKNLFVNPMEFRLIINIDRIGAKDENEEKKKVREIFYIINCFGFREVKVNIKEPDFPSAFWWCFKNIESELFFNLEEDWKLEESINFKDMHECFIKDEKLVHLRLSAFRSNNDYLKNWNRFSLWNGSYFEVKKEDNGAIGWSGHPSLNRTSFIKECSKYIDKTKNHEKQIKINKYIRSPINSIILNNTFGVFQKQNGDPQIFDLGRKWMEQNGYKKKGIKAFFTKWEKVEE